MVCEGSKRIVVIKDIPSNFIEEAIFILKSDNGGKGDKVESAAKTDKKEGRNDFLLKEAELIIENYIKDNKMQAAARRERDLKQTMFKRLFKAGNLINLMFIFGIVILAFLMIKMF